MKHVTTALAGLALLGLTGCIAVHESGQASAIERVTAAAIEACGDGNVEEVTLEGFECLEDAE